MNTMLKILFISMLWFTGILGMCEEKSASQDMLFSGLIGAIKENNISSLEKLIARYGEDSINQPNDNGITPLEYAAVRGYPHSVRFLVKHHAQLNELNKDGLAPIHGAASNGKIDCVQVLIEHNADINGPTKDGYTPLHCAAGNGRVDCGSFLVRAGADIHKADNSGATPLHCAVEVGHVGCVKALVRLGADPYTRDRWGTTPLDCAKFRGHSVLHSFLTFAMEDMCSFCGKSGCKACKGCLLVGYCDDVCQREHWPTHKEKCSKKEYSGKILLAIKKNNGVKLRELGPQEISHAYHPDYFSFAVRNACLRFLKPTRVADDMRKEPLEAIRALIELGVNVNAQFKGNFPLWYAVLSGYVELVTLLLKSGSEVDFHDAKEMTPLHVAASFGDSEIVELLLASNASVIDKDSAGNIPLFYAKKGGHESVVTLIEKALIKACQVCKISDGTIQLCKGCRSAAYCSTECQKKDWHNHKISCKRNND